MNSKHSLSDSLPLAGDTVDGRVVAPGAVPNQSAISSTLGRYQVLEGIRELSMTHFSYTPPYSVSEFNRTQDLASQIKASNFITPLIVVEDAQGFYILEGGHRFDALNMLGAKAFPALVVKDLDSLSERYR